MRYLRLLATLALALLGEGCSFASLRPPPTDGPALAARRADACGGKYPTLLYPLADATWVLAGGVEILRAGQLQEEDPQSKGLAQLQRGLGIASMVIATPSMIYGIWVAAECGHAPRGDEQHGSSESGDARPGDARPGATRAKFDFPTAVGPYAFGTELKAAESACRAQGDSFEASQNSARCVPKDPVARPVTELDYELGALNRVAFIYRAPKGRLNDYLDSLERNLQAQYGTPQQHRMLSELCIQSLGYCLHQGETPRGAGWHLPNGDIEMLPHLEQDDSVIEIRYSREVRFGP